MLRLLLSKHKYRVIFENHPNHVMFVFIGKGHVKYSQMSTHFSVFLRHFEVAKSVTSCISVKNSYVPYFLLCAAAIL